MATTTKTAPKTPKTRKKITRLTLYRSQLEETTNTLTIYGHGEDESRFDGLTTFVLDFSCSQTAECLRALLDEYIEEKKASERSEAAKQAWETRRRAEENEKAWAEQRRRSERAQRAAETRRRNAQNGDGKN